MLVRLGVRVAAVVVACGGAAHADEPAGEVHESSGLFHDPGEPLLTLDLVPRPNVVGLGVTEKTQRTAVRLGKYVTLHGEASAWRSYADAVPFDLAGERDTANGTRIGAGVGVDLWGLHFDASIEQNTLASRYGGGSYRDVSVSVSKQHRFSRWVTGWIALSLGRRTWDDQPPPGEFDSTQLNLSLGFTFR